MHLAAEICVEHQRVHALLLHQRNRFPLAHAQAVERRGTGFPGQKMSVLNGREKELRAVQRDDHIAVLVHFRRCAQRHQAHKQHKHDEFLHI